MDEVAVRGLEVGGREHCAGAHRRVEVRDVAREPRYHDAGSVAGSELAVPLRVGAQTFGVLDVQDLIKLGLLGQEHL